MATRLRMTDWVGRIVESAIDKYIPDTEMIKWDVGVFPLDPDQPNEPMLVIWFSINEPEPDLALEATYAEPLYDVTIESVYEHIRKAWDVCLVERMEFEFISDD